MAVASGGVTVAGGGTSALTLTGTVADINAYIADGNVVYIPVTDATADVTMSISISGLNTSGGTESNFGSLLLAFTPLNDSPTVK